MLIVIVLMFYTSCDVTWCDGNTTYTGKRISFRQGMNNHIIACRYGTSTDKFDNRVFEWSDKNVVIICSN